MAGQMNALGTAGFDAKGMMGNLDEQGIGMELRWKDLQLQEW